MRFIPPFRLWEILGGDCIKADENKALLNVTEFCTYLGIGQTKARELLNSPYSTFTVRIGNRLYANKKQLDKWLDMQCSK
ncbi:MULTISPECIES: excisionase [Hungatella]|uniref:excisionase n=1 Tax=Hungatella TaxID=1649459 RepID=UPI00242D9A77|nr:excisionase [Hungatella hathewayi]